MVFHEDVLPYKHADTEVSHISIPVFDDFQTNEHVERENIDTIEEESTVEHKFNLLEGAKELQRNLFGLMIMCTVLFIT